MNPLIRRDYPAEWQLLWTLGLANPNKNDEVVEGKTQEILLCNLSRLLSGT
jgi:hypothetical protein